MKIRFGKILNKKVCSLMLIGTITACTLIAPSVKNSTNSDVIKGNYSDEDVKSNKQMIMMITSKNKRRRNKTKVKSR